MPVSEFAIFAGLVLLVIGMLDHGGAALEVGIIVMALGVTEVTAREHFSGFRSHATLLAFMPAVIVEAVYALVVGVPAAADPAAGAGDSGLRDSATGCYADTSASLGTRASSGTSSSVSAPASAVAAGVVGSVSVKMAPPSAALAAVTAPPCCSATWWTIASPRPLPCRERELAPR